MSEVEWTDEIPDAPEGYVFAGWQFGAMGNGRRETWLEIWTPRPPDMAEGRTLIEQTPVWVRCPDD